jgi:shikimate dehydrogenase
VFEEDLEDAMKGLRAFNMRGVDLTGPHKVSVLRYLDDVAPDAMIMGAVNTVVRKGKQLVGENTDGKGFLTSLTRDGKIQPLGKRAVIFGAGGAARAVAVELAIAGVSHITVVNRTAGCGNALVSILKENTGTEVVFVRWEGEFAIPFETDIVVNTTPVGCFPDKDARPDVAYETMADRMVVCDMVPNPPNTPFLDEARKRGERTLGGQGMAVYQGAIEFTLWTGLEAPVEAMKKALEEMLNAS